MFGCMSVVCEINVSCDAVCQKKSAERKRERERETQRRVRVYMPAPVPGEANHPQLVSILQASNLKPCGHHGNSRRPAGGAEGRHNINRCG